MKELFSSWPSLAAGRHGVPTKPCLLTSEWCSRGQMAGFGVVTLIVKGKSQQPRSGVRLGQYIMRDWSLKARKCVDTLCTHKYELAYSAPLTGHPQFSHYSEEQGVCLSSSISPSPPSHSPPLSPDRASVLLSSTLSSFPNISDFTPWGWKKPITSLSCLNASNVHTHTTMSA